MKRTASLLMVFTLVSLSGCTSNVQDPAVDLGKTKAEASKVDADIFKVEWVKVEIPTEMEKKKDYSLPVTVKNASAGVWPSKGKDEKKLKQVAISFHWLPAVGEKPVVFDSVRTLLDKDVGPGESFSTKVTVWAPADPGTYRLQLTLVQEGVNWFEERGAKTMIKSIVVH